MNLSIPKETILIFYSAKTFPSMPLKALSDQTNPSVTIYKLKFIKVAWQIPMKCHMMNLIFDFALIIISLSNFRVFKSQLFMHVYIGPSHHPPSPQKKPNHEHGIT